MPSSQNLLFDESCQPPCKQRKCDAHSRSECIFTRRVVRRVLFRLRLHLVAEGRMVILQKFARGLLLLGAFAAAMAQAPVAREIALSVDLTDARSEEHTSE